MFINQDLVGRNDAGLKLSTPALLVDLDVLERNIARMAEHCRKAGLALRPHAKTHKSAVIARAQIAAGAVGICCAKVGEAEALAAGGVTDILITSPVVTPRAIQRLAALNLSSPGLMVVVDHIQSATLLSEAAGASGKAMTVLVDVDPGMGRTGVAPGQAAVALGQAVDALPYLTLAGLQCYDGDVQHLYGRARRQQRSRLVMALLAQTCAAFSQAGLATTIVSGGGTGSHDIDSAEGVLTELQAGSYVFMDRQYNELEHAQTRPPFETGLFVQATVISTNRPGRVTTDAGLKAFSTDDGLPVIHSPPIEGGYVFLGDEQGGVQFIGAAQLSLGDTLRLVPPHCDPTVNLYDVYHVMRGETLVDLWPIDGRGKSY